MTEGHSKRLIIVSNRLPFHLKIKEKSLEVRESDGGLVSALKSYFDKSDGQNSVDATTWIGAPEFSSKLWSRFEKGKKRRLLSYEVEPIFIDKKIYNKFYNGFCNATLWPLFHYFPSFVEFDRETFARYEEVNRLFAEKIISILKPGDVVWIHDYQLMLVPGMIREKFPDATIGFFLHIPFPSFELFRLLHQPWKEKIIAGLLGADLIGFHTHEYVQHFLKTVQMIKGFDHQYRSILTPSGFVKAEMFPLGIDFHKFHSAVKLPEVSNQKDAIIRNFPGRKIIFSVDRLDYTKGITHRLAGFEHFLHTHPEWREKIVFILVVVPSRQFVSKYNERKKLIEEEIGRINGKYSSLQWQPIIYQYNQLPFHELAALYHAADIGLITPLRDGMNLVAKEYVASRGNQGVLILSELAGAARELGEAILVNPMDMEEVAQAIHQALLMDDREQESKIEGMQSRLQDYTVVDWMNDFLKQLEETKAQQRQQRARLLVEPALTHLTTSFRLSSKRLLLLDYDGTLVPYAGHPELAKPDHRLIELLTQLSRDPNTDLTIISGRDGKTLENWLGKLPINLVSEHGAGIRLKQNGWTFQPNNEQAWKQNVLPMLQLFSQRSPGSFIEEKTYTLVWHYRNMDTELGFIRSRELLDNLNHLTHNSPLNIIDGNRVIEIRSSGIDKGSIALKMMDQISYDFVLAMGDDKTDEDMFRVIGDNGVTIKIGSGHTLANFHLTDHQQALSLLQQLNAAR